MDYGELKAKKDEQHIDLSRKMAEEIMTVPPGDQVEIVREIRSRIGAMMNDRIEESKKIIESLSEHLKNF
jgi:hypothetical protein